SVRVHPAGFDAVRFSASVEVPVSKNRVRRRCFVQRPLGGFHFAFFAPFCFFGFFSLLGLPAVARAGSKSGLGDIIWAPVWARHWRRAARRDSRFSESVAARFLASAGSAARS